MHLLHGDCRTVMAALPENSVDAIVTDPPYGLEFMGKEWDRLAGDWRTDNGRGEHAALSGRPSGKRGFDGHPPTPRYHAGKTAQDWHESWAREAYRVLKPGGHLLAFGGSRTYHRLACAVEDAGFEIRDQLQWLYGSGFPKSLDVSKAIDKKRDDYPAIRSVIEFIRTHALPNGWNAERINNALGWSSAVAHHILAPSRSNAICPSWEQWLALKNLLDFGDEMDAEVWRLNGRKGQPGEAWQEREVIGTEHRKNDRDAVSIKLGRVSDEFDITAPTTDLARQWDGWGTALKPAHEPIVLARKPLCVSSINVLEMVEYSLRERGVGEIRWTSQPAEPVEQPSQEAISFRSSGTQTDLASVESASNVPTLPIGNEIESALESNKEYGERTTRNGGKSFPETLTRNCETISSMPTVESVPVAQRSNQTFSPSTTLTVVEERTENPYTETSTANSESKDTRRGIESYAGIATGLSGSMAHVHISRNADGSFVWPENLPRFVPASSTVAATVTAHGTGALNIAQTRIGYEQGGSLASNPSLRESIAGGNGGHIIAHEEERRFSVPSTLGRWPANVLLGHAPECREVGVKRVKTSDPRRADGTVNASWGSSGIYGGADSSGMDKPRYGDEDGYETATAWECEEHCPIFLLDAQSGERGGHDHRPYQGGRRTSGFANVGAESGSNLPNGALYNDSGGPSRFFYCAKASRAERNAGLDGMPERSRPGAFDDDAYEWKQPNGHVVAKPSANHHPTVKPVSLMRWLVRLITPPGGTVLDPFMGSGTTGIAAALEGFAFIGIEQDAEYLEIARWRIKHWTKEPDMGPLFAMVAD